MVLQLFRPPGDGETLMECKLGDISDAISFEFERFFCGVGTFTLELPANSPFGREITANTLIYDNRYGECFVAKNIKDDGKKITVTGYDLGCLLRDRIVLPNEGAQVSDGHVCIAGTTEYCVKYFVSENLISADDNNRNYPRLTLAPDLGRGLENAHGYAAPESVDDVIRALCENAGLGYSIRLEAGATGAAEPLFVFDVADMSLRDGNRVSFSAGLGNAAAQTYESGITAHKNALWCESGGEPVFVFEGDAQPVSWDRREEYASIAVADQTSGEEITEAARETMADKFAVTHSLTVDAGDPAAYGTAYFLGDLVSVYDKGRNAVVDTWISAVKVTRKAGTHTVKLTMGEAKPKLLDGYAKQAELLKKYQRDYPAAEESTARYPTLKQYEVLSDTEITYNGTTYTFTAGEGGKITEVTTDKGGSFTPVIPGTIANITMHNAAFMAVAMMSRLSGAPEPVPSSLDQCEYRFNSDSMTTSGTYISWHNQGITNKDTDLEFTGASKSDGCGVFIQGTADSRGRLYYDCTAATVSARTVYLVANGNSVVAPRMFHMSGCDGFGGTFGASTGNNSGKWYFSAYINGPTFATDVPYLQKTVICMRLNENLTLSLFANGVHIGEMDYTYATKPGNIWFGCTAGQYYDGGGYTYYDFAVANMAHSNDEIIANMKFLMDKYNIGGTT